MIFFNNYYYYFSIILIIFKNNYCTNKVSKSILHNIYNFSKLLKVIHNFPTQKAHHAQPFIPPPPYSSVSLTVHPYTQKK